MFVNEFKTSQCSITLSTGEVHFKELDISLRPKTFELLTLLASSKGEVVTKNDILSNVWSDCVVEDQVVFQSINEIRKQFGSSDVIRTYPRRGYSWQVENTQIIECSQPSMHNSVVTSAPQRLRKIIKQKINPPFFGFFLVVLAMLFTAGMWLNNSPPSPNVGVADSPSQQGILILPFEVSALDSDQHWLKYAGMEYVSSRLKASKDSTVFQVEDALAILNRLTAENRNNPLKIFEKSGTAFIVSNHISGVPGDYTVISKIYGKHNVTDTILTAKSLDDIGNKILDRIKNEIDSTRVVSDSSEAQRFQQQLVIEGIQLLYTGEFNDAANFFNSALVKSPTDLVALYYLIETTRRQLFPEQTLSLVEKALNLVDHSQFKQYHGRLLFIHGESLAQLGKLNQAHQLLVTAKNLSKNNNDWLYHAYSLSLLGSIALEQQQFANALSFIDQALSYQELLQCPAGIVFGRLDRAMVYLASGETALAQQDFNIADQLLEEKQLQQAAAYRDTVERRLNL